MTKQLFVLLLFICILQSQAQKIVCTSNGNILNSDNKQIFADQVRELLKDNEKLLADYNAGRSKKTVGNVFIIGGATLVVGDVLRGVFTDGNTAAYGNSIQTESNFPSALTFIGLAALVVAIPVKTGFSKKIKNVVTAYNGLNTIGYARPKLDIITNAVGVGVRLTVN